MTTHLWELSSLQKKSIKDTQKLCGIFYDDNKDIQKSKILSIIALEKMKQSGGDYYYPTLYTGNLSYLLKNYITKQKLEDYTFAEKVYDILMLPHNSLEEFDQERLDIIYKKWLHIISSYNQPIYEEKTKESLEKLNITKELIIMNDPFNTEIKDISPKNYNQMSEITNNLSREFWRDISILPPSWKKVALRFRRLRIINNRANAIINGALRTKYRDSPYRASNNFNTFFSLAIIDYYSKYLPENLLEKAKALTILVQQYTKYCFDENKIYLIPKPKKLIFSNNQLHCESGPAFEYGNDTTELYFWHNILVEKYIIMNPEKITAEKILNEGNIEISRIMLERMGVEKFVKETKAKVVDQDIDGKGNCRQLLAIRLPAESFPESIMKIVKIICPSTGRTYMMRVPPQTITCQEAVAWTFGLKPNQYCPIEET